LKFFTGHGENSGALPDDLKNGGAGDHTATTVVLLWAPHLCRVSPRGCRGRAARIDPCLVAEAVSTPSKLTWHTVESLQSAAWEIPQVQRLLSSYYGP